MLRRVEQFSEGVERFPYRTNRINIDRININPNDYYNPVIDYYNPLLRFEPCLDQLGLLLILCRININLS